MCVCGGGGGGGTPAPSINGLILPYLRQVDLHNLVVAGTFVGGQQTVPVQMGNVSDPCGKKHGKNRSPAAQLPCTIGHITFLRITARTVITCSATERMWCAGEKWGHGSKIVKRKSHQTVNLVPNIVLLLVLSSISKQFQHLERTFPSSPTRLGRTSDAEAN